MKNKLFLAVFTAFTFSASTMHSAADSSGSERTQVWSYKKDGKVRYALNPSGKAGTRLVFDFKGHPATAKGMSGDEKNKEYTLYWRYKGLVNDAVIGEPESARLIGSIPKDVRAAHIGIVPIYESEITDVNAKPVLIGFSRGAYTPKPIYLKDISRPPKNYTLIDEGMRITTQDEIAGMDSQR